MEKRLTQKAFDIPIEWWNGTQQRSHEFEISFGMSGGYFVTSDRAVWQ